MTGYNHVKHGRSAGIAAILLAIGVPLSGVTADDQLPQKVIVKKGETLSSIVIQETGRTDPALWQLVARFNNRTVEQTLEIGDVILLPADLLKPQVLLEEQSVLNNEPATVDSGAVKLSPAPSNTQVLFEEVTSTQKLTDTNNSSLQPAKAPATDVQVQFTESPADAVEEPDITVNDASEAQAQRKEPMQAEELADAETQKIKNPGNKGLAQPQANQPQADTQQPDPAVTEPAVSARSVDGRMAEPLKETPGIDNVQSCEGQQVCFEVSVSGGSDAPEEETVANAAPFDQGAVSTQIDKDVKPEEGNVPGSIPEPEPTISSNAEASAIDPQQAPANPGGTQAGETTGNEPQKNNSAGNTDTREAKVEPPPAKPGMFEVDEEAAVRALERSLIQLNALLLSPRRAEATVSFDYSYNADAEPVLVSVEDTETDTAVDQVGQLQSEVENSTITLDLKFGLPYDSQINVSLPIEFVDQDVAVVAPGGQSGGQGSTNDGVGDFSITVDKTVAVEEGARPDVIASVTYDSDSGKSGIGSDAAEWTLGLRATKRQDPLVFTAGLSQTFAQKADDGFQAGDVTQFSIGTLLAASPYTSLQFLFNQALIGEAELNGQPIVNSDTNIANFSAGVSSVVGEDTFLNVQLSMGLVDRANDYRLSFSLAKQFTF